MMNAFMRLVIGGKTGSRQGAWFLILALGVVPFLALSVAEYLGNPMPNAWGALMVLGPASLAVWATAHGLEKAKDAKWIKQKSVDGGDVLDAALNRDV